MTEDHETASRRSIGARRNPATETAVLAAAAEILAEAGPGGLTMDAVAKRARAGKATIYRWWPTRGALLVAVYERDKGEHAHADTGALKGDLEAFFDHVFGYWRKGAGRVFAQIIAEAQSDAGVAEALDRYRRERIDLLMPVIDRAQARGEIAPGVDTGVIAESLVALLWYHLLTGQIDRPGAELAQALAVSWKRS